MTKINFNRGGGKLSPVAQFLDTQVSDVTGRAVQAGDLFGVELEMEGRAVGFGGVERLPGGWTPHRDGSLRDHHGEAVEWVFNGPSNLATSKLRISKLFEFLNKQKAQIVVSNRTSTHVHFNFGDKKVYQVVNLFILYTMLEDILGRYCGEDRNGNLFCLSTRHSHDLVRHMMRSVLRFQNFRDFTNENRYGGLNLSSLNKFNTVEFRTMRGLDNAADVNRWVDMVSALCNYACYTMNSPIDVVEGMSEMGVEHFIENIFGAENARLLTAGLGREELRASVWEGLRLVQILSYAVGEHIGDVKPMVKDFWAGLEGDRPKDEPEVRIEDLGIVDAPARPAPVRDGNAGLIRPLWDLPAPHAMMNDVRIEVDDGNVIHQRAVPGQAINDWMARHMAAQQNGAIGPEPRRFDAQGNFTPEWRMWRDNRNAVLAQQAAREREADEQQLPPEDDDGDEEFDPIFDEDEDEINGN